MTKILIIEDEAVLREEIMEWMVLEDYEPIGAEDGLTGVDCALHHQPDLILCDAMMPHLDGYEVLRRLRAAPTTQHIPFIFITARAASDDIRQGLNLGADGYITKPFHLQELIQAVKNGLAKNGK